MRFFKDRYMAGRLLAKRLSRYKTKKNAIVLAIPRGGVIVGFELAKELEIMLDIIVTKKIAYPGNPEYAIGAIASGNVVLLDESIISTHKIRKSYLNSEIKDIKLEIQRRYKEYGLKNPIANLNNKSVIIVDDGIATGYTTKASIKYAREQKVEKVILAIPVMPRDTYEEIRLLVDEIVCLNIVDNFFAISQFYEKFPQVEDEEVKRCLLNR
ncbi:MAG: phosphoribosyltransferase family protein [Nanoarchaeota archaeon]